MFYFHFFYYICTHMYVFLNTAICNTYEKIRDNYGRL